MTAVWHFHGRRVTSGVSREDYSTAPLQPRLPQQHRSRGRAGTREGFTCHKTVIKIWQSCVYACLFRGFEMDSAEEKGRMQAELLDAYDEELELELEDRPFDANGVEVPLSDEQKRERRRYFAELLRLQGELVKLQDWVVANGHKIVILFEGRDAAGKGGVIKRITQRLNPRVCRVAALPAPNDRERTQWYFQRYVAHLPAAGEIVLFDRSWYNRAGVERVMGFCTDEQYEEFFRTVPEFEKMLVRSGIQLIKYWFSISDEEQHLRFLARIHDPLKQWKLSPMDLESRRRWEDYTRAKEVMLERTHIPEARWWVVQATTRRRRGSIAFDHLLSQVDYHEIDHELVQAARARAPQGLLAPSHAQEHAGARTLLTRQGPTCAAGWTVGRFLGD